MNIQLARDTIQELVLSGVEEFVVCSGSRNSPLINVLLNEENLKKWWGFEERSSAFFALGRIRATGKPVAVVTTSGTAVGELLPATMEAAYTSLPLILLTADRPKKFRFTGAPQTCVQPGIFSVYVSHSEDIEKEERFMLDEWNARSPVHINVCFEEPAKERSTSLPVAYPLFKEKKWNPALPDINFFLSKSDKLLTVVSTLRAEVRPQVSLFLESLGGDVYVEATSGLREKFKSVEPNLSLYTHVLRIGGIPTHRLWRDLEETKCAEVLSLTENPFSGLTETAFHVFNLEALMPVQDKKSSVDQSREETKGIFHDLSQIIPERSLVYLGNSCPIRDWDEQATHTFKSFDIQANRGLNGIDGQLSTFIGLCEKDRSNVAILGDLTTLYDLSGPWFCHQLHDIDITLIIINNHGGRIFERIYPIPEMINAHSLSFEHFAKMWGFDYEKWTSVPPDAIFTGRKLVEIV